MTQLLKKTLCLYLTWALVFFSIPVKILSQNPDKIPVAILDLQVIGLVISLHVIGMYASHPSSAGSPTTSDPDRSSPAAASCSSSVPS